MAHELEFNADGSARMFYAREDGVPWHGFGTPVDGAQTAQEAIVLAGQDWLTAVGPLWGGPNQQLLEDFKCIYRVSDGKILGTCGTGYEPIQNFECFDFMDGLVQDRVMRYKTAGVLFGGKRIWILAELPNDLLINGDQHFSYILLVSWHDGGHALRAFGTNVRVICNNTVEMALGSAGSSGISVVHSGNIKEKLAQAQKLLNVTTEQQHRYAQWLEQLAKQTVTVEQVAKVSEAMFGSLDDATPTKRLNKIRAWTAMLQAEEARQGVNAYSLFQSLTGYGNYGLSLKPRADRSERFLSLFGGRGDDWNSKAASVVETIVGVERELVTV